LESFSIRYDGAVMQIIGFFMPVDLRYFINATAR